MKRLLVTLLFFILSLIQSNAQTTLFFQGFEGTASCTQNWGFTGGVVNTETARTGTSSARVGRSAQSNTLTFNAVNIASLSGVQLQIYHSVRSGTGPGMDTREGAEILVSLNGGAYIAIGQAGGNADAAWTWSAASGGITNTCSQTYTMPNPLNYTVPLGTLTIQVKVISVTGGASCPGSLATNMANGTAGNYDRTDEGFFVDDIKLTTTSTAIPGIWTGAVNTNWFNCSNWHNNKIPTALSDIIISDLAINDCIVDAGGLAVCRNITITSISASTPDLIIQNASTLSSGGNLNITKLIGTGICKVEILGGSTFTCNDVSLTGSASGSVNATFINEYSTNNVTVNGSFNLNIGGELNLSSVGNYGILNLKGNYTNNGLESDFKQTNSIVNLIGTVDQTINTNAFTEVFSNLLINKSSGKVILLDNISIETQLKLQSGLITLMNNSLSIQSNATTAIVRISGGVISEQTSNSSKLMWQIGFQVGSFVFPFALADGTYIPFIFNHTSGDAGVVSIATYGTPANNLPWPVSPVAILNLNTGNQTNNSVATVDRFWQIDVTGNPVADITFNYGASELAQSPYNNANAMQAQRYDYVTNTWSNYLPGQVAGSYSVVVPAVNLFSSVFSISNNSSSLPIQLLNFDASLYEGNVQLNWVTMTETNNALFTVQRSIDGHVFETVGTLPGAGNSTDKRVYNLLDRKPLKETSYYRLMQTDFDGSISYSPLVSIHNFYSIKSFQLFPNPASKIVYLLDDAENQSTYNLQLIALEGIELFHAYIEIGSTPYPINIQNLIPGVYILLINSSYHAEQIKLVVTD